MHREYEKQIMDLREEVDKLLAERNAPKFSLDKALREIEFLAWAFLLATFALKIFGFDVGTPSIENERVLAVIHFVDSNNIVRIAVNVLLGSAITLLMYQTIFKQNKLLAVFYIVIPQLAISALHLSEYSNFTFVLSPLIYLILWTISKDWFSTLSVLIVDNFLIALSAIISSIALDSSLKSFSWVIFLTLDYYLMWVLVATKFKRGVNWRYYWVSAADYLKKKLTRCATVAKSTLTLWKHQLMKLKKLGLRKGLLTVATEFRLYIKHDLRHKLVRKVLPHVVVFTVYTGYAFMVDKLLQAVFLYIAYLHLRKLFPKHFHADYIPNIKKNYISITCICLSSLMLCTALYNVIGGGLSVISSIIVAFVVDWLLYVIRDWLDRLASDPVVMELLKWFNKEERLKKKCADVNMSALLTEICIDWKINKLSRQQQADKYGYALNTIRKYRNDIENLLKTK